MEEEAPEVREQPRRESSAAEVSAGQRGLGGVRCGWGSGLGGGQVWLGVMFGYSLGQI